MTGSEGNLMITGEDVTKIVEARHHLHSVIEHIRNTHPPMQFVSIPVLSDEIKDNFEKFKVSKVHFHHHLNSIVIDICLSRVKL